MPFEEPGLLLITRSSEHSAFRIKWARRMATRLAQLMGAGGGFSAWLDFLKQPDQAYAAEAEQGCPAEDVYEGPEEGLAADLLVYLGLGPDGAAGSA